MLQIIGIVTTLLIIAQNVYCDGLVFNWKFLNLFIYETISHFFENELMLFKQNKYSRQKIFSINMYTDVCFMFSLQWDLFTQSMRMLHKTSSLVWN